jgi:hypothetical protein
VDAILPILVLLALAAPIGIAAAWFTGQGPDALASFFRRDHGLGWPHCVQEEDPPAWNWERTSRDDAPTILDGSAAPAVEAVAFQIGRGAARRRR